jgi:integrase/recombinase XerD
MFNKKHKNMSKITIYSEACNKVEGFRAMGEEFIRKLVINGKSRSTHENYLRQISKLALYYKRTPLEIEADDLEEYLYYLIQRDTDAQSSYKHLVYGLRKLYYLFGQEALLVALPKINRSKRLPVVLSKQEVKELLLAPKHIRERVMFALIYDTGLRISEVTNLLIKDVDLHRSVLHVRQSKNKKDRYVVMSSHAVRGIRKHLIINKPKTYMFDNYNRKGIPISKTRVRALLKEALLRTNIKKDISIHSLRHTYATHQLEAGQNIMVLKESLGHESINSTLMYLHIAQLDSVKRFGSMDILYPQGS